MPRLHPLFTVTAAVLLAGVAQAGPPVVAPKAADDPRTKQLAADLHTLLLANLPSPLVETPHNWGAQKEVTIGLTWERVGKVRFRPQPMKAVKNDGHWEKVRVEAIDPETSLALGIRSVRTSSDGKTLIDADLGMDVRLTYEQQMWVGGKRMYAGETRAKCRAELTMTLELTSNVSFKPGSVLPDLTFRVRVTEANLGYRDLVCEHTAGVDGAAAKVLGNAVHAIMKTVKPNMEADLLAKANAAVVKAADTKEVRVSFDKLLTGKK